MRERETPGKIIEIRHCDKPALRQEDVERVEEPIKRIRAATAEIMAKSEKHGINEAIAAIKVLRENFDYKDDFQALEAWRKGEGAALRLKKDALGEVESVEALPLTPEGMARAHFLGKILYEQLPESSSIYLALAADSDGKVEERVRETLKLVAAYLQIKEKKNGKDLVLDNPEEPILVKGMADLKIPEPILVEARKLVKERTGKTTKTKEGQKELYRILMEEVDKKQIKSYGQEYTSIQEVNKGAEEALLASWKEILEMDHGKRVPVLVVCGKSEAMVQSYIDLQKILGRKKPEYLVPSGAFFLYDVTNGEKELHNFVEVKLPKEENNDKK